MTQSLLLSTLLDLLVFLVVPYVSFQVLYLSECDIWLYLLCYILSLGVIIVIVFSLDVKAGNDRDILV